MVKNSIIIPVYGNEKLVQNLLATLVPTIDAYCEIIVVDDGDPEIKINPSILPKDVIYLSNERNLGYSASVNNAVDISSGEYITTINSDILLDKNWLAETRETFKKDKEIGMVGAKLIYPNYGRIMHAGVFLGKSFCFNGFRMSSFDDPLVNKYKEVQVLCDALATMPKSAVISVGKYDETYFTSVEDLEMCLRLGTIGLKSVYNPKIIGYHKTAASGDRRYKQVFEDEKRFFDKWSLYIRDDTESVFQESLSRLKQSQRSLPKEAYIINLNRKNNRETLNSFLELSGVQPIAIYDYTQYIESTPRYVQKADIELLEILPFSHLNLRYPIVYIVDYFISLTENTYWALNRRNQEDMVFDYAFNLYYLNDIVHP